MTTTRRERARTSTVAEIKAAALRQVATEGAPALSIRGVARAIGMSPAGLYRYYDGRDALLTDLLVDAYNDLADAVAAAGGLTGAVLSAPSAASIGPGGQSDGGQSDGGQSDGGQSDGGQSDGGQSDGTPDEGPGDPTAALLRAIEAYRAWAVANPARFLLIFGTPVPGYEAPEQGPTVEANRRMGAVFFTLAALAWQAGQVADPGAGQQPAQGEGQVLDQLRDLAPDFPAGLVPRMLAGWALWHGLVTLEVTGQLHWIYPDPAAFFSERMAAWVAELGGPSRA